MNPDFFRDLNETFDYLAKEEPHKPLILTSANDVFSVGLDFDHSFALFNSKDMQAVNSWFEDFTSTIVKAYTYPAKTIAAINGHAFAGGLILALCCDYRIGVTEKTRYALNEVPIGIPMPAVYNEIIRRRVGNAAAFDTILTGRIFREDEALKMGFLQRLTSSDNLMSACTVEARKLNPESWAAYVETKKLLLDDSVTYIKSKAKELDIKALEILTSESSLKSQQAALIKLKRTEKMKSAL